MGRRRASDRIAWGHAATLPGFDPRMVPEVAAGYHWDANIFTGLGGAGFTIPERGGRTTFDLIQATLAQQPAQLTENGVTVWRFSDAGEANPSRVANAAPVTAGWTGATMIAGWFRLPDASGDITGTNVPFGHRTNTTQRRLLAGMSSTGDRVSWSVSGDGSTVSLTNFPTPFDGAFKYCEWIYDPQNTLGGSTDADRAKFAVGLALQTRVADATTLPPAALHDSSTVLFLCSNSASSSCADRIDWAGGLYYCNGIPSLFNRQRLMAYRAPIATAFM